MNNKKKKRILIISEASYTNSGFGNYANEILKRLVATEKYDIAEFASYGLFNDPRDTNVKWPIYVNAIKDDDPRINQYRSNPINQFGAWRFDRVCLDFKPEIVLSYRDPWMIEWEKDSPFRRFFHQVWMPTCDSKPQQESWIDSFKQADGVFTYSDWGLETLREQGGDKIKLQRSAPPGTDLSIFKPTQNKTQHRQNMGLSPDINIIGTIMRNQRRKLYPDLFAAFKLFLEKCEEQGLHELAQKTFLFIHTSYPDAGWNIPILLREYNISHKVLFSYVCRVCHQWFSSHFQDALGICPYCNNSSAILPNVSCGVSTEKLADIIKCFDVYIQYAICLGKDEEILTKNGWKAISTINIGEEVWTHKHRWKKVLNVWKNKPHHQTKKIIVCGDYDSINVITDNHPVYAITKTQLKSKDKRSCREILGTKIKHKFPLPQPEFIPVSTLCKDDMIYYAIDDNIKDISQIDLATYAVNANITHDTITLGNNYPRFIDINEEFCKFIGLFTADGNSCLKNGRIQITSHINEHQNILLATNIFQKIGNKESTIVKTRKYPGGNAIDTMLYSVVHRDMFFTWCKNHKNKKLPDWALYLPLNKQKAILQGLFMGDGHFVKDRNVSIYCTISKTLADQIKFILRRLRINFNIHLVDKNKYNHYDNHNRQPQYRFEIYGNIKGGEFNINKHNTKNCYINNYHLLQIKSIDNVVYNDQVYNIDIEEDHSYTTRIGNIKNCEGFGMPMVEAASCGIPIMAVDYSAMSDVVRKTGGIPLKVKTMFLELETQAYRAFPDNEYTANEFIKFFQLPFHARQRLGFQARIGCEKHYNWDNTTKIWEAYFDSVVLKGVQGKWNIPPNLYNIPNKIPDNLSNEQFIDWIFYEVIRQPELRYTYVGLRLNTELNLGTAIEGGIHPVNRDMIFQYYEQKAENTIIAEKVRCCMLPLVTEDFINYAHMKEQSLKIKDGDIIT